MSRYDNIVEIIKFNDNNDASGKFAPKGTGGYSGHSMSNRAVRAYQSGEKPLSKWNKKAIMEDEEYGKALDSLKAKEKSKIDQWKKLPEGHWRHEYVKLYESDFEEYARKYLIDDGKRTKIMQGIKNKVGKSVDFSILKADDKRLVFGWASIAITVDGEQLEDRQHDMIEPEDLEDAAYEYVLNFRDTGEEHLPGYRKKGKLVESCVLTEEKQRAMGIPAGSVPVGWWIGFKIEDDAAWERVKNGTYKMFSIEGRANREPVEKAKKPGVGVLVVKDGKILTGTRLEARTKGQLCGPGGHIEPGETPEEAAIREAYEEFGIVCQNLQPLGALDEETPGIFLCTDFSGTPKTDETEITAATWRTPEELQNEKLFEPFAASLDLLPQKQIRKFNPFHDAIGRFSSSHGMKTFSANPQSRAGRMAIRRSSDAGYNGVMNVHRNSKNNTIGQNRNTIVTEIGGEHPDWNPGPVKKPKTTAKPKTTEAPKAPDQPKDQMSHKTKKLTDKEAEDMRKQLGQDRDSLTDQEYAEIKAYIGTGNSFNINSTLRNFGPEYLSPGDRKAVETIERKMKPVPEDIHLVRKCDEAEISNLGLDIAGGERKLSKDEIDQAIGKVNENKGLMSTGYSINDNCFTGRLVTLKLNCPKGKEVLFSPDNKWPDGVSESEVVLGRNTAYKITGIKQVEDGWGGWETIVYADILLD